MRLPNPLGLVFYGRGSFNVRMGRNPKYLRPYRLAQRIHGADFRTTLWASRDSQRLRFSVMAEAIDLAGRRVLDAGCGLGDFLAFLEEHDIRPAAYVGVDALEEVIPRARQRRFETPAEFLLGDLVANPELLATGDPEIVCIGGTLNTFTEQQLLRTLDDAWAAAGVALAFNFLSIHHHARFTGGDDVANRHDPMMLLRRGLERAGRVQVRHDYFDGHDCTMVWHRPEGPK